MLLPHVLPRNVERASIVVAQAVGQDGAKAFPVLLAPALDAAVGGERTEDQELLRILAHALFALRLAEGLLRARSQKRVIRSGLSDQETAGHPSNDDEDLGKPTGCHLMRI